MENFNVNDNTGYSVILRYFVAIPYILIFGYHPTLRPRMYTIEDHRIKYACYVGQSRTMVQLLVIPRLPSTLGEHTWVNAMGVYTNGLPTS